MAKNKYKTQSFSSAEWLASCGFIFPSNELELKRFNILYGPVDPSINGEQVNPFDIINRLKTKADKTSSARIRTMPARRRYQMVAKKKK